jgi:glutamate synthase domain-containing protein 2
MSKAEVADTKPAMVKLEAGKTYYWCSCGRSNRQPFCDGSHAGSEFEPLPVSVDEPREAALCLCKQTSNPPWCDGSHARISVEKDDTQHAADNTARLATAEEPTLDRINQLATHGLSRHGSHGEMVAMGVPRSELPLWDDIQILTAQFAKQPLAESAAVVTDVVIGPAAARPLQLEIPLLVSDMSYGALSEEAKVALARGAEQAGTGICSGEGGILPEERQANSRYFYELASAMFGYDESQLEQVQAFHFKGGQAAKTGTGGHLPAAKVTDKIARIRNLSPGQDAISPPTFVDLQSARDFRNFAARVREVSGGIPVGMKLSANHIEQDIDFALDAGVDYVILDGRGGGTGAAPRLFRDHISVPTIPALARARRHLDRRCGRDVSLVITGGLRVPEDFIKAMALGADAIALASSALQAIGCVAARMCNTNQCPSGVATQDAELRSRLNVDQASARLARFLLSSVQLMSVMARACGHDRLDAFRMSDLSTWDRQMADLTGIHFAGDAEPTS